MAITSDIDVHFTKDGGSTGYTYSVDCQGDNPITFDYVGSKPSWLSKSEQGDKLTITVDEADESVLHGRDAQIDIKIFGKHCAFFNISQDKGIDCDCNNFTASGIGTLPNTGSGEQKMKIGSYNFTAACINIVETGETNQTWVRDVELQNRDILAYVDEYDGEESRGPVTVTVIGILKTDGSACPKTFELYQNGKGLICDCNFIQSINLSNSIPPEGGNAGFVLGTMQVTDESCSVTFTSTTTDLHVGTASTSSNNELNVILTQKGPNNTDPEEDTPSTSYTVTALVNGEPCSNYTVSQDGTMYCDCDHIKIDPQKINTQVPPVEIDNLLLLSADTKGCGIIEFDSESSIFKQNGIRVVHDEENPNIIYAYVDINALEAGKDEDSGNVSYAYILNGQQDQECKDQIRFHQTKDYCGCQYNFEVLGHYEYDYPEFVNPRYLISQFYYENSPSDGDNDYIPYTIAPILYNYYNDYSFSPGHYMYSELDEKLLIADLIDNAYKELDCHSFYMTVGDDTDWITVLDSEAKDGRYKMLRFIQVQNNNTDEDRVGTITIHRVTKTEGECNPIDIKVRQRHNISSCDELFEALDGYYTNYFNPPNEIHSPYIELDISGMYVPYGKLEIDFDEDILKLEAIYATSYNNANYLEAKIIIKDTSTRTQDIITPIEIYINLQPEEGESETRCKVFEYNVTWLKHETPVQIPCDCDYIHLSSTSVIIPYNFGTECEYSSVFGSVDASNPSDCGEISGYTSDEEGNYVVPETYDWFTITDYKMEYRSYVVFVKLNYIPTENKMGYFKPFLVKDGERRFDLDCGGVVGVSYIADCSYSYNNVYKPLGTENIIPSITVTHDDVNKTFSYGFIKIGIDDDCYTDLGIECENGVSGYIKTSHDVEYISDAEGKVEKADDGTYRINYSVKFAVEPTLSLNMPIHINVYIGGRKQYAEDIIVDFNYVSPGS